jgi:pimeloyl-ACP methyl ester carboxylesterase
MHGARAMRRVLVSVVLLTAAVSPAGMQASAQQPGGSLFESVPWLVKNQGPGAAKGVIYLIHGYGRLEPEIDDYVGVQPFVIGLNRQGWDVIGAKVPYRASGASATDLIGAIGPGLPAKADALRKKGYQRVVFGGQSWGAWLALVATTRYRMKADGLILIAPATYGKRSNNEGQPNPNYARNKSEFLPLIAGDSTPSIVVFFKDDDYDPGGRGAFTQSTFDKRAVPYILIDGPAGLVGHGASWFPLFDYAFGDCFATFLAAPATTTCRPPPLDDADFRSVLANSQIADAESHPRVAPSDLAGRRFVRYSDGTAALLHFNGDQSFQVIAPSVSARRAVSSQNGALCLDNRCRDVVKWDPHRMIAFDPKDGAATAWWIELEEAP